MSAHILLDVTHRLRLMIIAAKKTNQILKGSSSQLKKIHASIAKFEELHNKFECLQWDLANSKHVGDILPASLDGLNIHQKEFQDSFWDDPAFDDVYDNTPHAPPRWLSNLQVRTSISRWLEVKHAKEELEHLDMEYISMTDWIRHQISNLEVAKGFGRYSFLSLTCMSNDIASSRSQCSNVPPRLMVH